MLPRIAGGVIWSYGNATTAPYTEQFYIGGANSIRAYSARSIGPGGYPPDKEKSIPLYQPRGRYPYGSKRGIPLPYFGDLHGAIFLDGNVWLMRKDKDRPDGQLTLKNFPKQVALVPVPVCVTTWTSLYSVLTGGVALHDPYDTGKKGYYNIPKFKDGMAWHFAIGYPF